jgi:hypothetical protein
MEALKKMSAKSILGNVRRFVPLDDKRDIIDGQKVDLFRVTGMAIGLKKGTGDNGDWIAFSGEFYATRMDHATGEILEYGSSTLFLPAAAEALLTPTVLENDGKGVEFAFDIGIIGRPNSSVGYEFSVETPLQVKKSEVVQKLVASLPPPKWARTVALAAPAQTETQDADKAQSPAASTAKGKKQTAEATA